MQILVRKKTVYRSLVILLVVICCCVGYFFHQAKVASKSANTPGVITTEDSTQIIALKARGGFTPNTINAKANVKTKIRVATKNTFDCSSTINIPKLQYSSVLPASGTTDIEVPPQAPGTVIAGTCEMGMYGFNIHFN